MPSRRASTSFACSIQPFQRTGRFWISRSHIRFGAGIIGGAFFITASHGTDQLIVPKAASGPESTTVSHGPARKRVAIFFQFALFLFVGVLLFRHYRIPSAAVRPRRTEFIPCSL